MLMIFLYYWIIIPVPLSAPSDRVTHKPQRPVLSHTRSGPTRTSTGGPNPDENNFPFKVGLGPQLVVFPSLSTSNTTTTPGIPWWSNTEKTPILAALGWHSGGPSRPEQICERHPLVHDEILCLMHQPEGWLRMNIRSISCVCRPRYIIQYAHEGSHDKVPIQSSSMKPTLMTTAHVACWTIRERSSSRMGRWSLERSTALKPAAASPCRATAWRFAAWLRLKKAWSSEEKMFWKPPKSIKKKKPSTSQKSHNLRIKLIPNGLFEKKNGAHLVDSTWSSGASKTHGARLSGATPPKDCSGVTNVGDHQMISMSIACYRLTTKTTTTTRYCLHPCNV